MARIYWVNKIQIKYQYKKITKKAISIKDSGIAHYYSSACWKKPPEEKYHSNSMQNDWSF